MSLTVWYTYTPPTIRTYTFHRLNLGNTYCAHIVVNDTTKVIVYMSGPHKRGTKYYFPVGWRF